MNERPIIFSAPMVRAILDGTKTQTRRVIRQQGAAPIDGIEPHKDYPGEWTPWRNGEPYPSFVCPYGAPSDRLWVREEWASDRYYDCLPPREIPRSAGLYFGNAVVHNWHRKRSAMYLPRWASRLSLEVTDVRVQRAWEISREDVIAEGCAVDDTAAYRALWDSINGKRYPWALNPWVWALTFRRAAT